MNLTAECINPDNFQIINYLIFKADSPGIIKTRSKY